MTAILLPAFELPLLGSNQDSPDPESAALPSIEERDSQKSLKTPPKRGRTLRDYPRDNPRGEYVVVAPINGLTIQIRDDCECSVCRSARGLEPLSSSELTARREARAEKSA